MELLTFQKLRKVLNLHKKSQRIETQCLKRVKEQFTWWSHKELKGFMAPQLSILKNRILYWHKITNKTTMKRNKDLKRSKTFKCGRLTSVIKLENHVSLTELQNLCFTSRQKVMYFHSSKNKSGSTWNKFASKKYKSTLTQLLTSPNGSKYLMNKIISLSTKQNNLTKMNLKMIIKN